MPIINHRNQQATGTEGPKAENLKTEDPKYTFDQLIVSEDVKDELLNSVSLYRYQDLLFKEWGFDETHPYSNKLTINLYGPPGTGKTMAAHALAAELKKKLLIVNYAEIESKYVGETPKNLHKVFIEAKEADSILFFDEADALLSRRVTNMNNATDTSVNQTRSVLLSLLNDYQHIVIFATNYLENFDPAFMRRILFHIKMPLPDLELRERLFAEYIPKGLPTDANIQDLALKSEGFSGSEIANVIFLSALKGVRKQPAFVSQELIEDAIFNVRSSKSANEGRELVSFETRLATEEEVKKELLIK